MYITYGDVAHSSVPRPLTREERLAGQRMLVRLMPRVRWPRKAKTAYLVFRAVLCMVTSISVLLATPAGAASCQAKASCDMGQACSICAEAKSKEQCSQIAFCDWGTSCSAASTCSWFQDSACVLKEASTLEDLCSSTNSPEPCKAMDFCQWKDDCRQCANFSANRDCVSRDFCEWDQGTLPAYPITTADIISSLQASSASCGQPADCFTTYLPPPSLKICLWSVS